MDIVDNLMQELMLLRQRRMQIYQTILLNEPDAINVLIADAVNALENLYIMINMPKDGFQSLTPGAPDGEEG